MAAYCGNSCSHCSCNAVPECSLVLQGTEWVLDKMGMGSGSQNVNHMRKTTEQKLMKTNGKTLDTSKMAQKWRKLELIRIGHKRVEGESVTCTTGGF